VHSNWRETGAMWVTPHCVYFSLQVLLNVYETLESTSTFSQRAPTEGPKLKRSMKKAQALALGNPPAVRPTGEVRKNKMAAVALDRQPSFQSEPNASP